MEVKKSSKANLEDKRGHRLLLGLVIALTCCFVALEYTVEPDDPLDDPELLARLESEMELPPMLQQENELVLAPIVEQKPETKLVIVEDVDESELLNDDEPVETEADDDMEAIEDEEKKPETPPTEEEVKELRLLEDMPQFPGGQNEFMKWLSRNLKYPPSLEQQKIQGSVVSEFIVEKDGSVTNVKVTRSLHPLCDAEVLRVLRLMPRWTAGIDKGQPCRTKVCIPVLFRY